MSKLFKGVVNLPSKEDFENLMNTGTLETPEGTITYSPDDTIYITPEDKIYDLIIRTQSEFETFYMSLDHGTCTAASVLLVGDGGALEFTRSDGGSLLLPTNLKRLDGINSAKIVITNYSYDSLIEARGAIYYSTMPTSNEYSINNISVSITSSGHSVGFYNCANLNNCTAMVINTSGGALLLCRGFYKCSNLYSCTGSCVSDNDIQKHVMECFFECDNLINCFVDTTASSNAGFFGFRTCNRLNNCTTSVSHTYTTYGFFNCSQLNNCNSISTSNTTGYGFSDCTQLSNCVGTGTGNNNGYSFYNCKFSNGCKSGSQASKTAIWGGTNTGRDDTSCELDA